MKHDGKMTRRTNADYRGVPERYMRIEILRWRPYLELWRSWEVLEAIGDEAGFSDSAYPIHDDCNSLDTSRSPIS